MHIPEQFQQNDPNQLYDIIRNYPFATLITQSSAGIEANHIPLILEQLNGSDTLQGHVAKANLVWKGIEDKSEALVIFNGPNCYISPNHYPTKMQTGKAVPTWNYVSVQVKGLISCVHDKKWNLDMLNKLTDQHEAQQPSPWSISDAPESYIQSMLGGIVGLEIEVQSIQGKWKVSQNQPEQNRQGVVEGLSKQTDSNSQKIAELVKEHECQQ